MKFAAFVFVASFFLVSVTAKAIEDQVTVYEGIIRKSINCGYNEVLNVRNVTQQVIDDVKNCKGEIDETTQKLIDSCHEVLDIAGAISDAYKNQCQGGEHIGDECRNEITDQVIRLGGKMADIGGKIVGVPSDVNECAWKPIHEIVEYCTKFHRRVWTCITTSS